MGDSASDYFLTSVLTLMFVAFKLCGIIDWSWWWVLSPIWIEVVIFLLIFVSVVVTEYIKVKRRIKKRGYESPLDNRMKAMMKEKERIERQMKKEK